MQARHLLVTMYQTRQPLVYRDGDFYCGNERVDPRNLSTLTAKDQIEPKAAGTAIIYTITEKGEKAAKRAAAQSTNTAPVLSDTAHRNGSTNGKPTATPSLFDPTGAADIVAALGEVTHRLNTTIGLLTKIEAKLSADLGAGVHQRAAILEQLSTLAAAWATDTKGGE